MPDHKRAPAIAGLLGLLVFWLSGNNFVASAVVMAVVMLGHISDQLHYLIVQRTEARGPSHCP